MDRQWRMMDNGEWQVMWNNGMCNEQTMENDGQWEMAGNGK